MTDRRLTPSFWLSEFLHSATAVRLGISNSPDAEQLRNIETVLAPGMQAVRELLGCPVIVSSGLRVAALNRAVGGAATSDHMKGTACDFRAPAFGTPLEVCRAIEASSIPFKQLIHEGTWVHLAFPAPGAMAVRDVLTARFAGGRVGYVSGLVPKGSA